MNKSKKVIFAGVIASFSILSFANENNVDIDDFSQNNIVSSVTVEAESPVKNVNDSESDLNTLTHFHTHEKIPLDDALKDGGIFIDPVNPDEILYLTLDHKKVSYFDENNFKDKEDFEELSFILKEMNKMKVESLYNVKIKDLMNSSVYYPSSFYQDYTDPDFINISSSDIDLFEKIFKESGASKDSLKYIDDFIFYHEYAHSHDHQERFNHSLGNERDKNISELAKENYADSYALLMTAKSIIEDTKDPKQAQRMIDEFYNGLSSFRNLESASHVHANSYNDHYSSATIYGIKMFIDKNFEKLEHFNHIDLQQISSVYTNRTLNHESLISKIQENKTFNKFLKSPSEQNRTLKEISSDVYKEASSMIKESEDFEGNIVSASFEYDSSSRSKILKNKRPQTNRI